MRFSLSADLLRQHPTYRVGLVCVWDADNSRDTAPDIRDALRDTATGLVRRIGGQRLQLHPAILAWDAAFETANLNPRRTQPSVTALAERALQGEPVPSINPAVDIGNLMSLRHLVPLGAHDMDILPGDVDVRLSEDGDTFTPSGERDAPEPVPPGEPVYATGHDVRTRRWIWRQGRRAMVTKDTRTILFPVDGFSDSTGEAVEAATHELAVLARDHLDGKISVAFVDATTPFVELSPDSAVGGRYRSLPDTVTPAAPAPEPPFREAVTIRPPGQTALAEWSLSDLLDRQMLESVIVRDELEQDLQSGKRLTIYQGFDPTSTSLHMGHYLSLRVLRWFQVHGHRVIFLFGDFTARIGDPTGQSAERRQLTHEQVIANTHTWRDQIAHVLDMGGDNPIEIKYNGEWLDTLTLRDAVELAANVTVQQLIERDMFQERLAQEKPLHLHETLYPLLQGYDSVAMSVDAELGGRDQMFNMMVGRDLVRSYLGKTKHVLMTPLIPGLDGRKMSKTYGNTVDLTEPPVEMFFKLTQVSDDLLPLFLGVFTDASAEEIGAVRERLASEANLQDVRERFAREVTDLFHGPEHAARAEDEFRRVVDEGQARQDVAEVDLTVSTDAVTAVDVAVATGLTTSRADARRLIQQGGMEINEQRQTDPTATVSLEDLSGAVVKMGKRGYVRMTVTRE